MEFENPYMKVLERNEELKAAVLKPLKSNITKDVLDVLKLKDNIVKEKRIRKDNEKAKSSPYQMRTRKRRAAEDDRLQPLRRISPRILSRKQEEKSLEGEYLADQTMVPRVQEKSPRKPEGPLGLQDHVLDVENEGWEQHVRRVGCYPPPLCSSKCRGQEAKEYDVKGSPQWWVEAEKAKQVRLWDYPKKDMESLDRFKERVSNLSMWCGCVARVLLERITSLAVHPSKDKLVIAAGGKKGTLGLWIVNPVLSTEGGMRKSKESDESATGLYRFVPHTGQINCTSFCDFRADRLITTSYDGTVRSLNFERLVFDQLLYTPQDISNNWMQWHCQMTPNVFLVSQGSGNVYVVDDRTNLQYEAILRCYERSCRTVSIHPLHPMYLATSSSRGYVSIWDLRKFSRKHPKRGVVGGVDNGASISHMSFHGTVSSAFFSPTTGNRLLTTSSDDHIRIYDTSKLGEATQNPSICRVETDIRHHHKTFMWLTPLRATWHPWRDDAFVIGSLANPRQVEIFGIHGRMLCALGKEGHFPINTVCPVNAFHPNRMLLASADSGGRVHILL